MAHYTCHCCGALIITNKPQDPQRDEGYGSCAGCHEMLIADAVKYGFCGKDVTREWFQARLDKYA